MKAQVVKVETIGDGSVKMALSIPKELVPEDALKWQFQMVSCELFTERKEEEGPDGNEMIRRIMDSADTIAAAAIKLQALAQGCLGGSRG